MKKIFLSNSDFQLTLKTWTNNLIFVLPYIVKNNSVSSLGHILSVKPDIMCVSTHYMASGYSFLYSLLLKMAAEFTQKTLYGLNKFKLFSECTRGIHLLMLMLKNCMLFHQGLLYPFSVWYYSWQDVTKPKKVCILSRDI